MAQLISVRLTRPDGCPLGFRLQGGKDFGTPLVIQKVNGGSPADKAGLAAGDSVIKVNNTEVFTLRHKEAQDVIVQAGQNFDITVQRGGGTWKPSVSAVGSLPSPARSMSSISPVTQTSLKANHQPSHNIGSGYNSAAKPFNYMNGNGDSTVKSIVNKQYNTPVGIYSEETIAETLSAQAEVLAGGVLGVNFKKNEKTYDSEKSEVFKMLQEADNDPEPEACTQSPISGAATGLRHVSAPVTRPDAPLNNTGGLPPGQNICEECERLIIGVFVRIKDKNLHVECFKCATCGSSLKNQGYYNLNGKLYCDIHAKMVARQNPPAPNLEPYTVPQNKPSSTFSSVLPSAYSVPLPPLSNPIYSPAGNGPSSLMNKNDFNGNMSDLSLKLNQDNVDAFANIASGNDDEKDSRTLAASFNSFTNGNLVPAINNNTAANIGTNEPTGVSDNLLSVYPISIQTSPVGTISNGVYKKVIPPHMGGNYKPSGNISGPRPFGAPLSPAMHSPVSSLSPRSAPGAPVSPASTLPRPSHQFSAPAPTSHSFTGQFSTMKAASPFKGGAGAAARGKTFGVSSAPKRGRGILNMAAGPGSRVALCAHCNGHIRGPFITALGRIWCPEHFVCVNNTCRRHLQDIGFVEENGQLYCEYCFEQFIAPACDKCHGKIKGDCLNAIGKHFHPECFNCAYCGKLFGNNPFFLEEGLPYCEADWNELFTTKCIACGFPVEAGDRCAKRTSRDRVSTPREDVHSASLTHANILSQERNSLSPFYQSTNVADRASNIGNASPNQYSSGIFDDILSLSGKVLSKVTVDKIHSSTYCDVTDVPAATDDITEIERDALRNDINSPISVTDTFRTETFTNEDILKIKLTPTLMELDDFLFGKLTPSIELDRPITPLFFTKEKSIHSDTNIIYKSDVVVEESDLIPLHMDNQKYDTIETHNSMVSSYITNRTQNEKNQENTSSVLSDTPNYRNFEDVNKSCKNLKIEIKKSSFCSKFLNMPAHYHAAIICFLLVAYNLMFNMYKHYYQKTSIHLSK